MKKLIIILICCTHHLLWAASLDDIKSSLEELKQHDQRESLYKEGKIELTHEESREIYSDTHKYLVNINRQLETYIPRLNHNVGIIGNYPEITQKFIKKSNEAAELLEPYIPNLLSTSYSEINKLDIHTAYSVLHYVKPSEKIKQALLNNITTRKYPKNTNIYTYQTLFNLNLQDDVIITNLKVKILNDLTNNSKSDSVSVLYALVKRHIIPEFIPLIIEDLKQVPNNLKLESRLREFYGILRQISDWGDEAAPLLPYIHEQMALLETAYQEAGLTLNRRPYEDAVGIIGKDLRGLKIRRGYAYLVDAQKRGELDSNFNLITADSQTTEPSETTQSTNQATQTEQITAEPTQNKTSNWFIYALAAVVLLVILIVLKLKKKQ